MKYLGITETYDPCFVPDWDKRLLDANIIISKELTDDMIKKLVANQDKIIFHHTVTGLGESVYEPNVPSVASQFDQAMKLFNSGFDIKHYVLRVDPIIPYFQETFYAFSDVLKEWQKISETATIKLRCRVSILDQYQHVINRFKAHGINPPILSFTLAECFSSVEHELLLYTDYFDFECCAEPRFKASFIEHIGCASNKDMKILGLPDGDLPEKLQRKTCLCLAKKQILGVKPKRCPHQCLYCFWKD